LAILDSYSRSTLWVWASIIVFAITVPPVVVLAEAQPSPFLELLTITSLEDCNLNLGIHLSLACDQEGTLFLSDAEHKCILRQANRNCPRPFELKPHRYLRPYGLTIDHEGWLYIANPDLHEVLVLSLDGQLKKEIGGFGSEIEHPIDLAITTAGLIYVLDDVRDAILVLDAKGTFKRAIQLPVEAGRPISFSVSDQRVFVVFDGKPKILIVDENGPSDWFGQEGYEIGQLKSPASLEVREGYLYVIDRINNAVQVYDLDGHFIREYILYKNLLHGPLAFCVHGDRLYIANALDQILEFRMREASTGIEHSVLGEEYYALAYYEPAAAEFRKAIRLGYDPAETHFSLGLCYYILESYAEATEQFLLAKEKNPSDVETIFQLANSLYRMDEYTQAVGMYHTVLTYKPAHILATYNLGETYLKLGDEDQAEECFNKLLGLDPDSIDALLGLGRVYVQREAFPKALETFNSVLKADPANGQAPYYMGLVYFEQCQYEEASKALEDSASKGPFFIDSLYHLGLCYLALGEEERAISCFENVIQAKPSHEEAQKRLEQIQNSK